MNQRQTIEAAVIKDSQQIEMLLLEACDSETRALLRLADISIWPCGCPARPTITITCKSREITEAIGLRQATIKLYLKRIIGCSVCMAVHYVIPEGLVYFDTEGEVAPAKWYLYNRKDCGHLKIPLPG